jgi:UDP-N-acetyl-D-mannosaminuronic acid dehydrogenase
VGLPLALAFAKTGAQVCSFDIDDVAVNSVNAGRMPFLEPQGDSILKQVLESQKYIASTDPEQIRKADVVIVVIGTPVDEHLNPNPNAVPDAVESIANYLNPNQLLVLRSTVFPGVTKLVENRLNKLGIKIDISFCPERIAEGKAFEELYDLPQIVSGRTDGAVRRARELFSKLTNEIVVCDVEEAELAKLFTNSWRYIKFAAANQFFMIANERGIDFEKVRKAITYKYPRAADMPGPGFAAGPCLFKDTMQLAATSNNTFFLGHSSMLINEGLPSYIIERLEHKFDLSEHVVGILGMSFKGESDDIRSSLSYKLRRLLISRAREVLIADPFVTTDPRLVSQQVLIDKASIIVIGAPHKIYKNIEIAVPVIDIWNLRGDGVLI